MHFRNIGIGTCRQKSIQRIAEMRSSRIGAETSGFHGRKNARKYCLDQNRQCECRPTRSGVSHVGGQFRQLCVCAAGVTECNLGQTAGARILFGTSGKRNAMPCVSGRFSPGMDLWAKTAGGGILRIRPQIPAGSLILHKLTIEGAFASCDTRCGQR